MRLKLKDFFAAICRDVVYGARQGTTEAVQAAKDAEALTVEIPIAGQPLRVEGAANMPSRIMLARRVALKTQGYIGLDDDDEPVITLKRGLFEKAPEIEIEIEFERSRPLESLEMARDRANEANKEWIQIHRAQLTVAKQQVEAEMEKEDADAKQQAEAEEDAED